MRVEVSPDAARLLRELGGRLWVGGPPAVVLLGDTGLYARSDRTAIGPVRVPLGAADRAGRCGSLVSRSRRQGSDVLEIGLRGKRRPRVEAYWDGCRFAL